MHKSPFKNATWLSLMLGLSRNLLSIRQGPGDHNPSYDICIRLPVCPTGGLCKAALSILRGVGAGTEACTCTSKTLLPTMENVCVKYAALWMFSTRFFRKTMGSFSDSEMCR